MGLLQTAFDPNQPFGLPANTGYAGAPNGWNWWQNGRFYMPAPTSPPPPPALPMAPTPTPTDQIAQQVVRPQQGQGGSADSGGSQGGATRDQDINQAAMSGAQSPSAYNSNLGLVGGTLGMIAGTAAGIPGPGTVLGTLGEMGDLRNYSNSLAQANIPFSPNYGQAALAGLSSLPFGLGNIFGTSARQQFEDARRDALANGNFGATAYGGPGGFSAEQANAPVDPVTRESAPMASYPAGFLDWSGGLGNQQDTPGGLQGVDPTGPGGFGSPGPGPDAGGYGPGAGAGPDAGGAFGPGFAKGGTVRPPLAGVPNPPGPDDQVAGLQTGEGVITRSAMQKGWGGLLDRINQDKTGALARKVTGLLR